MEMSEWKTNDDRRNPITKDVITRLRRFNDVKSKNIYPLLSRFMYE